MEISLLQIFLNEKLFSMILSSDKRSNQIYSISNVCLFHELGEERWREKEREGERRRERERESPPSACCKVEFWAQSRG